ncbi:MAG: Spy/CpxP family protein refolding chaperone [Pseudomonadota bacterium]
MTLALIAALAAGLFTTGAYAEKSGDGAVTHSRDKPSVEMRVERMAQKLGLDDTQRDQVTNIMTAAEPEFNALREQRKSNRDRLQAVDADSAEVQEIAASNGEIATQVTLLKTRVRSEIDAVLTEDQRAELAQMEARRAERFDRRRGRRSNQS